MSHCFLENKLEKSSTSSKILEERSNTESVEKAGKYLGLDESKDENEESVFGDEVLSIKVQPFSENLPMCLLALMIILQSVG